MKIQMIGIDHSSAGVRIREQFAFTASQAGRAMEEIKKQPGVKGCVLLSTCNRMELYVSTEQEELCLWTLLADVCRLPALEYAPYFQVRSGQDAAMHLMYLAAGLKSRVLGEGQILSQVKEALRQARERYCTDPVLEVLFRCAVTAGKEVKAKELFVHTDASTVHCALAQLRRQGFFFEKKNCLVIGNGVMGKTAALALREAGALVTVTVRQYRSGQVSIPVGCSRINYGNRLEFMENCDMVVSATASPNFKLKTEDVAGAKRKDRLIMIDLAVPRDIEPGVGELPGITLYDIDSFELHEENEQLKAGVEQARGILTEYIQEFTTWYDCRDLIPVIQEICTNAAKDVGLRIHKEVSHLEIAAEEKNRLEQSIDKAASKVVNKLMFDLRENLNMDTWRECVEAIAKIYP